MTLFNRAAEDATAFNQALAKYFQGEGDSLTLKLLR
jgi:uncharacterized protein (DUF1810 family)